MTDYCRYINTVNYRVHSYGRRIIGPSGAPVPGNMLDPDPRKKFKHKFSKWYKLPRSAAKLYWRTHPQFKWRVTL